MKTGTTIKVIPIIHVEHRGVEPLTSTMRMSRATAGPKLHPNGSIYSTTVAVFLVLYTIYCMLEKQASER